MNFPERMHGYDDPRTFHQIDALHAWKHGKNFPPVLVEIDPSTKCIQKCRYCYNQSKVGREILDGELLLGLPRQLKEYGAKAILFQGSGEPLMSKALPQTINNGAEVGIQMTLTTSGVLLRPKMQDKILQDLHYVRFSVLESDPKRYVFLHGCHERQWYKLIENIKYAVELRQKKDIQTTLLASVYLEEINFAHAFEIVKFLKELGLDYVIIQEAVYGNYSPAGNREYPSSNIGFERIYKMKNRVSRLNDDNFAVKWRFPVNDEHFQSGLSKDTFKKGFCQGLKFTTIIASDGNVYPCWRAWGKKELNYGSLYEQSFKEIWEGRQRQRIQDYLMNTPPEGSECSVCNNWKTNTILDGIKNASKWKDFMI